MDESTFVQWANRVAGKLSSRAVCRNAITSIVLLIRRGLSLSSAQSIFIREVLS